MVIFNSYVKLPEGKYEDICLAGKWICLKIFGRQNPTVYQHLSGCI